MTGHHWSISWEHVFTVLVLGTVGAEAFCFLSGGNIGLGIYSLLWRWVTKKLVSLWLNRVAITESSFLEWKLIKRSTHLSKVG